MILTIIIIIIIVINNNAYNSNMPISPRGFRKAYISPKDNWNLPGKNCEKLGWFCITKIRLGEIS